MIDRKEISEVIEAGDPAAQAFETLRQEIVLLRLAVTGLSAEHSAIEIPDYSETLGHTARMVSSMGKRLVALTKTPAFGYTPQQWSEQFEIASENARRKDREMLALSCETLRKTTDDLVRSMRSARAAAKQDLLLIWVGGGGVAVGMLLWVFCVEPIVRAVR